MNPDAKRSIRISELTHMALNGKSLDEISDRAHEMASHHTAKGYVEEVQRRMRKLQK